jgi:formylglycine-generating enzyme required for sulfatase activity
MVNVPQGEFYVGDRNSAWGCFYDSVSSDNPFLINTEDALYASGSYYREMSYGDDGEDVIAAGFPKGYRAFWMMKYEITQYQYAEFLNTLTPTQAQARTAEDLETMTEASYVMCDRTFSQGLLYRQGIIINPQGDRRTDLFYCNLDADNNYNETNDGMGIACNYLSARDVFAYLDWAGLRPMTEFEFEKACRGSKYPVQGEYAWGSVSLTEIGGVVSGGTPDERTINVESDGSCNWNSGTSDAGGPMRVGFAATANTNRVQAGCSYYGIMDLSGNVQEPYLGIYADPGDTDAGYSSEFNGQNGDGVLAADGQHNVNNWPDPTGTNDYDRIIGKGGHWADNEPELQVSRRYELNEYDDNTDGRNQYLGGRGGRTDYR